MKKRIPLDRAFTPRVVVVVGDKQANDYMWLRSLSTFTGKLYSVQIDPTELPGIEELGVENYYSLLDIPEAVDYVIIAVPREITPRIISDCIDKGVGGASLFTSGFAETNTEEGRRLQEEISRMANDAGLNLIGPNCMGVFNPRIGLRQEASQYSGETGPVGFIAQSGTHAILFSTVGHSNGINISRSVSYGNAAVLDSTDYLEYLAGDSDTRIIGMYMEGVRDGNRFLRCLRETTPKKPVVVWKGGRSEEGSRATASHTGVLSSSPILWATALRQCGAVQVHNLYEMVDTVKALLYLKPPAGNRVGLVADSGGQSVVITDAFTGEGLRIPLLSKSSYKQFASFFNVIGGSYLNPLDISWNLLETDGLTRILTIVSGDRNIDTVVFEMSVPFLSQIWEHNPAYLYSLLETLAEFKTVCPKCFALVLTAGHKEAEALQIRHQLAEMGLPCFPTFERAARAIKNITDYHRYHRASTAAT